MFSRGLSHYRHGDAVIWLCVQLVILHIITLFNIKYVNAMH